MTFQTWIVLINVTFKLCQTVQWTTSVLFRIWWKWIPNWGLGIFMFFFILLTLDDVSRSNSYVTINWLEYIETSISLGRYLSNHGLWAFFRGCKNHIFTTAWKCKEIIINIVGNPEILHNNLVVLQKVCFRQLFLVKIDPIHQSNCHRNWSLFAPNKKSWITFRQ